MVDDAHGFGTLGKTRELELVKSKDVRIRLMYTSLLFAKSMAGFGAFLSADENIIRFLKYNLRSQIFAKSLTMPMVIGG